MPETRARGIEIEVQRVYTIHMRHLNYKFYINSSLREWSFLAVLVDIVRHSFECLVPLRTDIT